MYNFIKDGFFFFFIILNFNKLIEQKVFFSKNIIIPDFIEKVEELGEYPENSIVILENLYFQPEEIGFNKNEEGDMFKLTFDEKQEYIRKVKFFILIYFN